MNFERMSKEAVVASFKKLSRYFRRGTEVKYEKHSGIHKIKNN
jgi:hypothetical protein